MDPIVFKSPKCGAFMGYNMCAARLQKEVINSYETPCQSEIIYAFETDAMHYPDAVIMCLLVAVLTVLWARVCVGIHNIGDRSDTVL